MFSILTPFALTKKVRVCIAADSAILYVHSVFFSSAFFASTDSAWILMLLLMSHNTPWILSVSAYSASIKFLIDSMFTFSLSATLLMWTVIFLA